MSLSKSRCKNAGDGLAYITECTLATVERLAMAKSPPIGEFNRQCSIAQTGIEMLLQFNLTLPTHGRLFDIASTHLSVIQWAADLRSKFHPNHKLNLKLI